MKSSSPAKIVRSLIVCLALVSPNVFAQCGPGPNWVPGCPPGIDNLQTRALLCIDLDFDPHARPDEMLILEGPTVVRRAPPVGNTIQTEIIQMQLTGGGVQLRGGSLFGLPPSFGQIIQPPSNPLWADSFFDVFVEVTLPGGLIVRNQQPIRMGAFIDRTPPDTVYVKDHQIVPLLDLGGNPVARLVTVHHKTQIPPPSRPPIVINEFSYDDSGTDNLEFVELYNCSSNPVDLSGWRLENRDAAGLALANPVLLGAVLAPDDYYVIGNTAVPGVDLVVPSGFMENDVEAITLYDGGGMIVDTVMHEVFQSPAFAAANPTLVEGEGIWGELTMPDARPYTWSRYRDGYDTGNNHDFALRRWTPGASNNRPILSPLQQKYNTDCPGDNVAHWMGTFKDPWAVDPTVIGPIDPASLNPINPNAIPPSPDGGLVYMTWDPAGGGNAAWLETDPISDICIEAYVYFDANPELAGEVESWTLGVQGGTDTFYRFPNHGGTIVEARNGNSGVGLTYEVTSTGATLYLVDYNDSGTLAGGAATPESILGVLPITPGGNDGWQRVLIEVRGNFARAEHGGTFGVPGSGTPVGAGFIRHPAAGGVYVGYRELVLDNSTLRPFTMDCFTLDGYLITEDKFDSTAQIELDAGGGPNQTLLNGPTCVRRGEVLICGPCAIEVPTEIFSACLDGANPVNTGNLQLRIGRDFDLPSTLGEVRGNTPGALFPGTGTFVVPFALHGRNFDICADNPPGLSNTSVTAMPPIGTGYVTMVTFTITFTDACTGLTSTITMTMHLSHGVVSPPMIPPPSLTEKCSRVTVNGIAGAGGNLELQIETAAGEPGAGTVWFSTGPVAVVPGQSAHQTACDLAKALKIAQILNRPCCDCEVFIAGTGVFDVCCRTLRRSVCRLFGPGLPVNGVILEDVPSVMVLGQTITKRGTRFYRPWDDRGCGSVTYFGEQPCVDSTGSALDISFRGCNGVGNVVEVGFEYGPTNNNIFANLAVLWLSVLPPLAVPIPLFGCELHINPISFLSLGNVPLAGGEGFISIPIPPDPFLVGGALTWQGLFLENPPGGIIFSSAMRTVFGPG